MSMDVDDPQDYRPEADHRTMEDCRRLSGPGLRTFVRVADLWGVDAEQRRSGLGRPDPSTYRTWLRAAQEHRDLELPVDVLMRISAVLGIHGALGILHAAEQDGVAWLRGANGAVPFKGRTPLDLMLDGTLEGLVSVRWFLDALTGGQGIEPNQVDRGFRPYIDADVIMS